MSANIYKFNEALARLNTYLKLIDKKIVILAVGGFALMWHGVRGEELTVDIDSLLNERYSDEVVELIRKVGLECDLEEDWLNTQWSEINHFDTSIYQNVQFIETDYNYSNIDIKVAELESLLYMKLLHAEEVLPWDDIPLQDVLFLLGKLSMSVSEFKDYIEKYKLSVICSNVINKIYTNNFKTSPKH